MDVFAARGVSSSFVPIVVRKAMSCENAIEIREKVENGLCMVGNCLSDSRGQISPCMDSFSRTSGDCRLLSLAELAPTAVTKSTQLGPKLS